MNYYLVIYDIDRPKGVSAAMQKRITKDDADKILGGSDATIYCEKGKYTVRGRRLFIVKETETLFIVVDAEKQKR